jgi:putative transposase
MILNEFGRIAHDEWEKLPDRFQHFELDAFQIMPNHMHGIIFLQIPAGAVRAGFTPAHPDESAVRVGFTPAHPDENRQPLPENGQPQGLPLRATVGDIVGAYKSLVANKCLDIFKSRNKKMGKLWQGNYYEHIIRDDVSYQRISEYIYNNPEKWQDDKFFI